MPFTPKFVDLVRNVTTVSGTGPVTLGAAVNGFASLANAISSGEQFYYCIQGIDKPQEREVGRGTMQADGKVARQAIAGNLTNFTSGAKTIALVAPAEWFARLDGAMATAASRSELAGKDGPATGRAYLAEKAVAGTFTFDPSDLSAMIAADPRQGLFVAPGSAPTGTSGAWVRQFSGSVNVKWFGAAGDGVTNDGAAFLAAIAVLKAVAVNQREGINQASPKLFIPAGHYFLGSNTLDITHTLVIEGEGTGQFGGDASKLRWSAGATGIRVQRHNTAGATGVVATGFNAGDASIIRGLCLKGGHAGTEGEFHGIHLRARALVEDCYISNFQGDGVYSNNVSGGAPEGNANNVVINRVTVRDCRRGLYFDGSDSNACLISMLDASVNRTWGVEDSSFLGNTYVGCHLAANGWEGAVGSTPTACTHGGNRYYVKPGQAAGASTNAPTGAAGDNMWWGHIGPGGVAAGLAAWTPGTTFREGGAFKTDNANARNLFLGCYTEGDQNPAQTVSPTIMFGGLQGAQVKGRGAVVDAIDIGNAGSLRTNISAIAANSYGNVLASDRLEFNTPSDILNFQWFNNDLIMTAFRSEVSSNWQFRLTGENTTANVGKRRLDFPNGFGLGDKKVLNGTAAPTSGSFVQGDMMFNSAPVAGGPSGWMCVADGSPGTWKAMGSLAA